MSNEETSVYTDEKADRSMMLIDIAGQMTKGTAIAAFVFFGPIVFIVALSFAGSFLPPESKEAVDPTPDSFVSSVQE